MGPKAKPKAGKCGATTKNRGRSAKAKAKRPADKPKRTFLGVEEKFNLATWLSDLMRKAGYGKTLHQGTLVLATGCSGLGTPTIVARAILGHDRVLEIMAAEKCPSAAMFLMRACKPEHIFIDMRDLDESRIAPCFSHCGKACNIPCVVELDMYVCGFVCKDNSPQNPKRFKEDPIRMQGESNHMDTFYSCRKFVASRKPKIAILENVWDGCTSGRGSGASGTVMDFLLDDKEHGLRAIPGYEVATFKISGTDVQIPMLRQRVFFLLTRTDVCSAAAAEAAFDHLRKHVSSAVHDVRSFLLPPGSPTLRHWAGRFPGAGEPLPPSEPGDLTIDACAVHSKYTVASEKAFRLALSSKCLPAGWSLLPLDQRPSQKRAVQIAAFAKANIDMAFELIRHTLSSWPEGERNKVSPVADVSQSINRRRFSVDGLVPTLTTSSRIWGYNLGRFITPSELLILHGLPDDVAVNHIGGLSWQDVTTLAGNGMIAPALGLVMCSALIALGRHTKVGDAAASSSGST